MKKAAIVIMVMAILSISAAAYAYWGGGPMWGYAWGSAENQKAFDETVDLRKQLHDKMFEYREAERKDDEKKIEALEKEIEALQKQVAEKLGMTGKGKRGRGGRGGWGGPMMQGGGCGGCGGGCQQGGGGYGGW